MKKLITGIVIGSVIATTAAGVASTRRVVYLKRGDAAVPTGSATRCVVRPHRGSRNGFICNVGGDYRAKYGVIVNDGEVAITQYTDFNRFRVIIRRRQSPPPVR